jgi:hypothetical protein
LENGTCTTLTPPRSSTESEKSSTLPKPSVATFSLPGLAFAAFSKSAQVLNSLSSFTKMKDGPLIITATGVMSFMVQRGLLPASNA